MSAAKRDRRMVAGLCSEEAVRGPKLLTGSSPLHCLLYLSLLLCDSAISPEFQLAGLSRGGQQIQKAREIYRKALETLVELASLQVSVSQGRAA